MSNINSSLLPKNERRNCRVTIRLSPDEHQALRYNATAHNLSTAAYLRAFCRPSIPPPAPHSKDTILPHPVEQLSSSTAIRNKQIHVRVSETEKTHLRLLAKAACMSTPELLRICAMQRKVVPIIDKEPLRDLFKVAADLGRLGGLLKLWLSEFDHHTNRCDVRKREIRSLLNKLNASADDLKETLRTISKLPG